MNDIKDAIRHHLLCEHAPVHRQLLCQELERIGLAGGDVPSVPQWEFMDALRELINEGVVIEAGERVAIDRRKVSSAGTKAKPGKTETQANLFD
jgi:hypothetical protein